MKSYVTWILAVVLMLGVSPAFAQDAVNKFCPMSGDKADPNVTYVHGGKTYAFCCEMCIPDFKKDPEKFVARSLELESGHGSKVGGGGGHAEHVH